MRTGAISPGAGKRRCAAGETTRGGGQFAGEQTRAYADPGQRQPASGPAGKGTAMTVGFPTVDHCGLLSRSRGDAETPAKPAICLSLAQSYARQTAWE